MIHPLRTRKLRKARKRWLAERTAVARANPPGPDDLVHVASGVRFTITKRLARNRFVVRQIKGQRA